MGSLSGRISLRPLQIPDMLWTIAWMTLVSRDGRDETLWGGFWILPQTVFYRINGVGVALSIKYS